GRHMRVCDQRSPCREAVSRAERTPIRTRSTPAPSGLSRTRCVPPPARTTTSSPSRSTSHVTARSPRWSVSSPTARAHPPPSNAFPRILKCLGLTARRNAATVPTGAADEDRGILLAERRHGGRHRDDLIRARGTPPTEALLDDARGRVAAAERLVPHHVLEECQVRPAAE